jgi:deoxycytidylate deaminase
METIVNQLKSAAEKSTMYRHHAACIIQRKKIISIGYNYINADDICGSTHAEVSAILNTTKKRPLRIVV